MNYSPIIEILQGFVRWVMLGLLNLCFRSKEIRFELQREYDHKDSRINGSFGETLRKIETVYPEKKEEVRRDFILGYIRLVTSSVAIGTLVGVLVYMDSWLGLSIVVYCVYLTLTRKKRGKDDG